MSYEIYITEARVYDEPIGLDRLEMTVNRVVDERIIITTTPLELDFVGDAYSVILNALRNSGRYANLPILINKVENGNIYKYFEGFIVLIEAVFDTTQKVCSVPVRDNNINAFIDHGKDIKVRLDSVTTKNGQSITPPTFKRVYMYRDVSEEYYNSVTESDLKLSNERDRLYAVDVFDAMQYLVSWLSDNQLTFRSNWYSSLPDDERFCVVSGDEVHRGGDTPPIVSLSEVFITLARSYNLWLSNEGTQLILETEQYFQNADPVLTVNNPRGIKMKANRIAAFESVKVGDGKYGEVKVERETGALGPSIRLFKLVELFPGIKTASGQSIDLTAKIGINTAVITDALIKRANAGPYAAVHVLGRIETLDSVGGYISALDVGGYYKWASDSLNGTTHLIQYDTSINEAVYALSSDQPVFTGNHALMNVAVLPRHNFGFDLYTADNGSQALAYNINEDAGYSAAMDATETNISFRNYDNASFYKIGGSNSFKEEDEALKFQAKQAGERSCKITVMIPSDPDNQPGARSLAFENRRLNYPIKEAISDGSQTLLTFDDSLQNYSEGDDVSVVFLGVPDHDWYDAANSSINNTFEIESMGSNHIYIDLDSSNFTDEFWGGVVSAKNATDQPSWQSGLNNETYDVTLKLVRQDSSGSSVENATQTFQSTFVDDENENPSTNLLEDRPLSLETVFDLDSGDSVHAAITITTAATNSVFKWLYMPLEFSTTIVDSRELFIESNDSYLSEVIEFEYPLSAAQQQSIKAAPYRAIKVGQYTGFTKRITLSDSRLSKFELFTNLSYFDPENA